MPLSWPILATPVSIPGRCAEPSSTDPQASDGMYLHFNAPCLMRPVSLEGCLAIPPLRWLRCSDLKVAHGDVKWKATLCICDVCVCVCARARARVCMFSAKFPARSFAFFDATARNATTGPKNQSNATA